MVYTIFCAILGVSDHNNAFPVRMDQTQTVGELISELNVALGRPEFSNLELYQVNVPVTDNTYRTVIESITQRTIKFDEETKLGFPFLKLSKVNGGFPKEHIHILVEVPAPAGESFSLRRLYYR